MGAQNELMVSHGGVDLNGRDSIPRAWLPPDGRTLSAQTWLRRASVIAALTKGLLCGALAGWLMWQSTLPMDGLAALMLTYVGALWLIGGFAYLIGAFLLARRWFPWRVVGGLLDAAPTWIVAWVAISFGERQLLYVTYAPHGPGAWPPAIAFLVAAVWIAASLPMMTSFVLAAVMRARRQRL